MKVYVAGPMRGYPEYNFPAFDAAAAALRAAGHEVFSPAEHDRGQYGDLTPENAAEKGFDLRKALAADLTWITLEADGVAVLDGWESSLGARAEVATALALGLLVQPVGVFGDPYGWRVTELPPLPAKPQYSTWAETKAKAAGFLWRETGEQREVREAVQDWINRVPGEVRSVSSTGGEKGVKPARFDLIPAGPLWTVAELFGKGAEKYEDRNWERGYEWSKSFGALQRHAWLFWGGEDNDDCKPDCKPGCTTHTGKPHLACMIFHGLALLEFMQTHPEFDDRTKVAA